MKAGFPRNQRFLSSWVVPQGISQIMDKREYVRC